jgi:tetratricopeptide (TPR) repeat protein
MKLVVVAALLVGCGGSKPDNGELVIPKTPDSSSGDSTTSGGSEMAVQAAGFNEEGKKAMFAGNYALASEHFRAAVARVPEAKYFFNLCTSLFQEGKFSEALTSCDAVEKNQPTPELSEKAKNLTAKINAEASKQGIAMSPPSNDPVVPDSSKVPSSGGQAAIAAKLSDEGVQLMYAKKYAEATAKFREAVARVPEPKYFFNLCTSLFQEGKFSEGLTACNAVEKNHPTPALQAKAKKMSERIIAEAKAQGVQVQSP